MPLPPLSEWHGMKETLHQAAQAIGQVRLQGVDKLPNHMEYGLHPMPYGLTTGLLKFGGTFHFDYATGLYVYEKDGEEIFEVYINGKSQKDSFREVFDKFHEHDIDLEPNWEKASGEISVTLNSEQAEKFLKVHWWSYSVLSRLKTWMFGPQSPILLFPHGFDLSTMWFIDGMDESKDPHLNFGWSPGTPDVGQPYFYFYGFPDVTAIKDKLPEQMTWHTEWSTSGGYIPYDAYANEEDSEDVVFSTLYETYKVTSEFLRK